MPMDPTQLSPQQAQHLAGVADQLLQQTLDAYDEFAVVHQRQVDPRQWKHWKRRDDLEVYRELSDAHHRTSRSTASSSDLDRSSSKSIPDASADANATANETDSAPPSKAMPRVLAIGCNYGALEDVLFTLAAATPFEMRANASYLRDDPLQDAAVLSTIKAPSSDAPFESLTVKRVVLRMRGLPGLRPRSFLVVESMGVLHREGSAQRVGFQIQHSLELAIADADAAGDDTAASIQRGLLSSCFLFHERADEPVLDVFLRMALQPQGNLHAHLTNRTMLSLLPSNFRTLASTAQSKKLAWLLQQQTQLPTSPAPSLFHRKQQRCSGCERLLRALARRYTCQLCASIVCVHCCAPYVLLSEGIARAQVVKTTPLFCKHCIAMVREESATAIARMQLGDDTAGESVSDTGILAALLHQRQDALVRSMSCEHSATMLERSTQRRAMTPTHEHVRSKSFAGTTTSSSSVSRASLDPGLLQSRGALAEATEVADFTQNQSIVVGSSEDGAAASASAATEEKVESETKTETGTPSPLLREMQLWVKLQDLHEPLGPTACAPRSRDFRFFAERPNILRRPLHTFAA